MVHDALYVAEMQRFLIDVDGDYREVAVIILTSRRGGLHLFTRSLHAIFVTEHHIYSMP